MAVARTGIDHGASVDEESPDVEAPKPAPAPSAEQCGNQRRVASPPRLQRGWFVGYGGG